jgi:hypothetical protein
MMHPPTLGRAILTGTASVFTFDEVSLKHLRLSFLLATQQCDRSRTAAVARCASRESVAYAFGK